jgi:hypothetical protein
VSSSFTACLLYLHSHGTPPKATAYRFELPKFNRIIPVRRPDLFDQSEWVYELKYDGFRALAYVEDGRCRFVSRKGNEMKRFEQLSSALGKALKVKSAISDGEIVALTNPDCWRFGT